MIDSNAEGSGYCGPAFEDIADWPLLAQYPLLVAEIDALCQTPWRLTGASALLYDDERFYLELTKPKHWTTADDGALVVGLGALGGSLERGEDTFFCLQRELKEEIGIGACIETASLSYIVYEGELVRVAIPSDGAELPAPVLFTVSANQNRRTLYPRYATLAIATFLARVSEQPLIGDVYGLLGVPKAQLSSLLRRREAALAEVLSLPGVSCRMRDSLPRGTRLRSVWTIASLQTLLRRGYSLG